MVAGTIAVNATSYSGRPILVCRRLFSASTRSNTAYTITKSRFASWFSLRVSASVSKNAVKKPSFLSSVALPFRFHETKSRTNNTNRVATPKHAIHKSVCRLPSSTSINTKHQNQLKGGERSGTTVLQPLENLLPN